MMRSLRSIQAVALTIATSVAPSGFASSLVQNGSFEQEGHWRTASGHHPERVSIDVTTAARGRSSLKLDGRGDPIFMLTRQRVPGCRPGRRYAVRAAVKATTTRGQVFVAIRERRAAGDRTILNLGRGGAKQPGHWVYLHDTFRVSEEATGIEVFLYNIRTQAEAWFDDVSVVACAEADAPFDMRCREVAPEPVIDGELTEWAQSDKAGPMILAGTHAVLPVKLPGDTWVGLMHDRANLYVCGAVHEPEGYQRKATQTGRDTKVHSDDCVELFLAPGKGASSYFHLCVNANGALYDSWKAPGTTGVGDTSWDSRATVRAQARPGGWDFEMALPLKQLHELDVQQGKSFTANVCRNLAGAGLIGSWARLLPGQSFHTPSAFRLIHVSAVDQSPPRAVSLYRLFRGHGYCSNPDFEDVDAEGSPVLWTTTGDGISQQLTTGFLAAGTSLDLLLLGRAREPYRATVSFRTPQQETRRTAVTLRRERGPLWHGTLTLSEDAVSLATLAVTGPDGYRPLHVQLAGTGHRRFIRRHEKLFAYRAQNDRSVLPPETGAVFTLYPELSLIRELPCSIRFSHVHHFSERTYRNDVRIVMDLPKGVTVYSTGLFGRYCVESEPTMLGRSPRGAAYRRVEVPYRYFRGLGPSSFCVPCFLTELPPGEHPPLFYQLVWNGGEQPVEQLPVRVYPRPQVAGPKRLIAAAYLHVFDYVDDERKGSIVSDPNATSILAAHRDLGLNSLLIGNQWQRVGGTQKLDSTRRLIGQMRDVGFELGLHTSGFHYFNVLAKKENALAVTLDGQTDKTMCPSYRGPAYQALIQTWGDVANHGVYWIDNDFEDWNYRENTVCFCERCKQGFAQWLKTKRPKLHYLDPAVVEQSPGDHQELHRAWWEFKNGLIEHWHLEVRKELAKNMAANGIVKPGFPRIGITESKTRWDWKRLTRRAIDYDSPMLYAYLRHSYPEPSVESCGRRMLEYRLRTGVDRHQYVVTICSGEGDGQVVVPDKAMLYQVLEVFGSGAAGVKVWHHTKMNGGKYYWMSQALRMIAPVEDLLLDGEFAVEPCTNPNARVHSFTHPHGTVIFVAEYSRGPVTVTVRLQAKRPARALDLRTGASRELPAALAQPLKVTLDEDRVRLLFIGTPEACDRLSRALGGGSAERTRSSRP